MEKKQNRKRNKISLTPEQQAEVKEFRQQAHNNKTKAPQRLAEHLQAFNDAVIAIIATIIVLEIKPPLHEAHYNEFIADIFIFLIAFLIIADFWYDLHVIFSHMVFKPNKLVVIFDMFLLADLSLMPVMTKWIMAENSSFAVMNFGIISFIAQVLKVVIQYFGSRETTRNSKVMGTVITRGSLWRITLVMILNLGLIALAFYVPRVAMVLYILLPLVSFLAPDFQRKRR